MAIPFNPPRELIEGALNRPTEGEQLNETLKNALATYVQMKQQQQANALAQEDRDIKLAGLSGDSGTTGIETLNALRRARGRPPLSVLAQAGESPIIAHFNSLMPQAQPQGGGVLSPSGNPPPGPSGKPTAPDLGSDPAIEEFNKIGSQEYLRKYGQKGFAKVKTALDIQKGLQEKTKGPLKTLTKKQVLERGVFDPSKEMIVDPSQESTGETKAERLSKSLRTELTGSIPYQRFTTLKAASENIANAVNDPGGYGDLGTLFDYMKALDPTSVVREGEQETFRKTGSFTQGMANALNKLVSGQTITPEQRAEVLKYTKVRLKTAHGIYKSHADPTLRQVKRLGIDPHEVDPYFDYKVDEGGGGIRTISNDADFAALPSGAQFRDPSGQVHTKR